MPQARWQCLNFPGTGQPRYQAAIPVPGCWRRTFQVCQASSATSEASTSSRQVLALNSARAADA
jgi:hypothetical protein